MLKSKITQIWGVGALELNSYSRNRKTFYVSFNKFDVFRRYFKLGEIYRKNSNKFICKTFLWIFRHPWGSWGRILEHRGNLTFVVGFLIKDRTIFRLISVQTGKIKNQSQTFNLLELWSNLFCIFYRVRPLSQPLFGLGYKHPLSFSPFSLFVPHESGTLLIFSERFKFLKTSTESLRIC